MTLQVRLLGPGDEGVVHTLAEEEVDFGLEEPTGWSRKLSDADAARDGEQPVQMTLKL